MPQSQPAPPTDPLLSDAPIPVVGLMSGTSMDAIDAAWLRTDGQTVIQLGPTIDIPIPPPLRAALMAQATQARMVGDLEPNPALAEAEATLTALHGQAVEALIATLPADLPPPQLIGMHGQTLLHRPEIGRTWQIGDGQALAQQLGLPVVYDFRSEDMRQGGQGAPLAPAMHRALAQSQPPEDFPLLVINLGGVANVTWIGPDGAMVACDTGPANGPCDDWVFRQTQQRMDRDGALALAGRVDEARIAEGLAHPYFDLPLPKSLDRLDFTADLAHGLSVADGAATLIGFSAAAVAAVLPHLPERPRRAVVAGGGRRNPAFMAALRARLGMPVDPVEAVGWDGDALEAQAFGLLAVRSVRGLPLTEPGTTGCRNPVSGGKFFRPSLGVA
ncbi:MAG: anhydro-N-acetylmuramic acid kinase [Rhodospirillaceae bacterium]